ncbi:MAG: hypothetical protein V4724_35665 [Pseudomonadota bacterium]
MKIFKTVPERGDFAFQQLVSPCQVDGAAMHDLRFYFGLRLSKSIPYGSVRDDEGHIYSFARSVMAPTGTPNPTKFIYQSTRIDGVNLRIDHARMGKQAISQVPLQTLQGNTVAWSNQEGETGNGWRLAASGAAFEWRENELFELTGKPLGNGLQWYLPGVDWGTFYVSQLFDVSGHCEGRPVKGVIAVDQVYMAEGGAVHFQKDLIVNNNKHVLWWTFATVYRDGSFDTGSFMVGHDNLGYAILMDQSGVARTTDRIEGLVRHRDGSYFAADARVILEGGEEWEFLPDAKGEMRDFVGGFPITAQQEGRWRRVGDTREPDHWMAWGETDRRNGSARNVPGADL